MRVIHHSYIYNIDLSSCVVNLVKDKRKTLELNMASSPRQSSPTAPHARAQGSRY